MVLTAEHERSGSTLFVVETAWRNGFRFSRSLGEGEEDTYLLGTKAANLAELMRYGFPVPHGFTLTTEAWRVFDQEGGLPDEVRQETLKQLSLLEKKTGLRFGDPENPLVVAARSSPPHSQPGLLSTVLDIGLNDRTLPGVARREGEWCAWDSYRRAIESYALAVLGTKREVFEAILLLARTTYGVSTNQELPVEALQEVVAEYRKHVDFPQDPHTQLRLSLEAVFRSWNDPAAIAYRRERNIPDEGIAVLVQRMILGNRVNGVSGSGVFFTRELTKNQPPPQVAFLLRSQGPDIVGPGSVHKLVSANELPPDLADGVLRTTQEIEDHYGPHPYEVEFAYDGRLWLLQLRHARLSPEAALSVLYEQVRSGDLPENEVIERALALLNVLPYLNRRLDPREIKRARRQGRYLGEGIPISQGVATGRALFSLAEAEEFFPQDVPAVLVLRQLTETDVLRIPQGVAGVVVQLGGSGGHFAQLLREARGGMGIPTIAGVDIGQIRPGIVITLDATGVTTGQIFDGIISVIEGKPLPPYLAEFLEPYKEAGRRLSLLKLVASYPVENRYRWTNFASLAETVLREARARWQSPKAHTQEVINAIFPKDIMLEYLVFARENEVKIRAALCVALDGTHEASLRTCHNPPKIVGAPWQRFVSPDQVGLFFEDPNFVGRYGGYRQWLKDPTLTEIVVGRSPRGKLDPGLSHEHAVFTVCCVGDGVILQIYPHTAQVRDLERADPDNIITITAPFDPRFPKGLGRITTRIGGKIARNQASQRFAEMVRRTVFGKWWEPPVVLPHRLAALQRVAGLTTFEGQVRVSEEEKKRWCLVYGAKGLEEKV